MVVLDVKILKKKNIFKEDCKLNEVKRMFKGRIEQERDIIDYIHI